MKNGISERNRHQGFTLIELLIAIAIVGIITAIALPSYSSYMENARRTDAKVILQEAAGEQIRFFSEYNRYATSMTELGYGDDATALSDEGLYFVSVSNNSATSFLLTATPVEGEVQANDTDCASFTISSSEIKGVTGAFSATPDRCW